MNKTPTHILIVDDDLCSRKVLRLLLERYALLASIDCAENGIEAQELWKEKNYDLAFIDIRMTPLNGVELVRRLVNDPFSSCTFVAYTANVLKEEREETMRPENGFSYFLAKPIDKCELERILAPWLTSELDAELL